MTNISLIGCGRWGTFLGWYAANYCGYDLDMYDIPTSLVTRSAPPSKMLSVLPPAFWTDWSGMVLKARSWPERRWK